MYTSNDSILEVLRKKGVLVASHRGACGGNVCQNNRLSYLTALLSGADMIEMDVIQSKDGVFYAYHNGTEQINLHADKDIREMTSEEIDAQQYYNWLGEASGVKVGRLEELLDEFEEKCLINIDRSWFYWKNIIEALSKRKNRASILLKSAPEAELLQILQDAKTDIMYMPIVKSVEDWERVKQYDINVAAVEVIFDSLEHPLVAPEMFAEWRSLGVIPWVNTISLGAAPKYNLSAHLDDNNAIADGFDENWGALIQMGFQILQTDWPGLLAGYVKQRNS